MSDFTTGDRVSPAPHGFPYEEDEFGLHRNSQGTVTNVNRNRITVDWKLSGAPEKGTYDSDQLMKI